MNLIVQFNNNHVPFTAANGASEEKLIESALHKIASYGYQAPTSIVVATDLEWQQAALDKVPHPEGAVLWSAKA